MSSLSVLLRICNKNILQSTQPTHLVSNGGVSWFNGWWFAVIEKDTQQISSKDKTVYECSVLKVYKDFKEIKDFGL